ncbi:2-octaprenyl-6-methoxyphenyl hydroxylase [Marinimicrobium sp. ARAG 43.8]|uniref:2-octaprenyl-6-methoxyphenyl hydroxylase n=1 Tax=Marinimicrobium sp. ARAG 43.8 TaxID=3418719 RepID=UPI003CEE144D
MTKSPDTRVPDYDIAIVGAGMVGSALAALLSASGAGWKVVLLDRYPLTPAAEGREERYEAGRDHRATALSAGSVEILKRAGLWSELAVHATTIQQVHVSDRGHLGGALLNAVDQGCDGLGYVLENAWLLPCLQRAGCQGAQRVLAPVMVTALEQGRSFTRLHLSNPSESSSEEDAPPSSLSARLVVLADGGASDLPRQLGINAVRQNYGQCALITRVTFERAHQYRAFERFTEDGPLALLPLGEKASARTAALVWTLPPARAEQMVGASAPEFLAALQETFGWRLGRFTEVGERQSWPLSLVRAEEQIRSRLVLLGNSAHYLHPVAGQGFNLSLRDATALSASLSRARSDSQDPGGLALLHAYQQRRHRDQWTTIHLSDRLVRIFTSRRPLDMALRHIGLAGLDWLPGVKPLFAAQTMGLLGSPGRAVNTEESHP